MLNALKPDRVRRNALLAGAGYAPEEPFHSHTPDYHFSVDQAAVEIERYPWPISVTNDLMEVVGANELAWKLWGVRMQDLPTHVERNMMTFLTHPVFARRFKNWDEAVSKAVAIAKFNAPDAATMPEHMAAYFAPIMERFLQGDPQYVARFLGIWETTPAHQPKVRFRYPIVWQDAEVGEIRMSAVAHPANEASYLVLNDWIPVDAESWERLEQVRTSSFDRSWLEANGSDATRE